MVTQFPTAEPPWEQGRNSPMNTPISTITNTDAITHQHSRSSPTLTSPPAVEGDTAAITMTTEPSALASPWTPNTNFTDMPPEILREIFYSIDGEFSRTLWSLCLACKLFRDIVEEHCEPEYNLRGKWIEDPYPLMERIRDQPYLMRVLRVLRMEYNFALSTRHTEQEVRALVSSLGLQWYGVIDSDIWDSGRGLWHHNGGPVWLSLMLHSVETIELSTKTGNLRFRDIHFIEMLHDPFCGDSILQSHGFEGLRNLTLAFPPIYEGEYSIDPICPINLMLPNLRRAKLLNCKLDPAGWYGCIPDFATGTSALTHLEIHDHRELFTTSEHTLNWGYFANLKSLRLHLITGDELSGREYSQPRYVEVLSPLRHTLEDLQLYSNERCWSEDGTFVKAISHHRGQPTLTHFTKLRSLALTDISFMGASKTGPTHWHQPMEDTLKHAAEMFPPTLEYFTHLLWDGPTAFSTVLSRKQQKLRSWENIWKAADSEHFPNLKKIMIQEYGAHGPSEDQEVIWEKGG